jgi:hypothetical protein
MKTVYNAILLERGAGHVLVVSNLKEEFAQNAKSIIAMIVQEI